MRNASHRDRFSIWTGDGPVGANGATLIAAVDRPSGCFGFFTRDTAACVIGADWGVGMHHPVVSAPLVEGIVADSVPEDALERALKPGDRVLILASGPGRPARQFGAGFVDRVLRPELEAIDAWRPGDLVGLAYTDRYLKAPLPVILMMRVLAALRDRLASKDVAISLSVDTEPLRIDRGRVTPARLGHDWQDEGDRANTIAALAAHLHFTPLAYQDQRAAHGRKVTMRYRDGREVKLLFDQGFGYWRASSGDRHDFRASPGRQAKDLLDSSAFVAGLGESYIAIAR